MVVYAIIYEHICVYIVFWVRVLVKTRVDIKIYDHHVMNTCSENRICVVMI